MLNIHVVHTGGEAYYLRDLRAGDGGWEVRPAAWVGAGAGRLGLAGAVAPDDFAAVMGGCHPGSGERSRHLHGPSSVSGYDLTFCAPNSVSVLHGLAPAEVANEVGRGHDAAVAASAEYVSRRAVGVVRRAGSDQPARRLSATGPIAGELVHRTSRALDPHLHTHLVVANVAEGVDGRWSALDSRRLFAHARAARAMYHAVLRSELTERLGVAWEVGPRGLGDVVGVDAGLRALFSQRAAAIAQHLATVGHAGPVPGHRARAVAATVTRPERDAGRSLPTLVAEWRGRAADFGFDLADLGQVVGRGHRLARAPGVVDVDRVAGRLAEVEPGRSLARRDVESLVAEASVAGASVGQVEAVADRLLVMVGDRAPGLVGERATGPVGERVVGVREATGVTGGRPSGLTGRRVGDRAAGERREVRWSAADLLRVVEGDGLSGAATPVDRGAAGRGAGRSLGDRSVPGRSLGDRGATRARERGERPARDRGVADERGAGRTRRQGRDGGLGR